MIDCVDPAVARSSANQEALGRPGRRRAQELPLHLLAFGDRGGTLATVRRSSATPVAETFITAGPPRPVVRVLVGTVDHQRVMERTLALLQRDRRGLELLFRLVWEHALGNASGVTVRAHHSCDRSDGRSRSARRCRPTERVSTDRNPALPLARTRRGGPRRLSNISGCRSCTSPIWAPSPAANPAWNEYERIASCDVRLLIDAGVADVRRAADLRSFRAADQPIAGVIAGLENAGSPQLLENLSTTIGPDRLIFSLDLRSGRPLTSAVAWRNMTPVAIAEIRQSTPVFAA